MEYMSVGLNLQSCLTFMRDLGAERSWFTFSFLFPVLYINIEGTVYHSIRHGPSPVDLTLKVNGFPVRLVVFIHKRKIISNWSMCLYKLMLLITYKKRGLVHTFFYCHTGIQMRKLGYKTWLKFQYMSIFKKVSIKQHSDIFPWLCCPVG